MANLTPIPSLDNIPQLETTTVALGGSGQPMNTQAQALLNRMEYYKMTSNDSSYNTQVGTAYTLSLTDSGITVKLNNISPITLTVPTFATVPFRTGTNIDVVQDNTGTVTVVPSPGVTIRSLRGYTILAGQYAGVTLRNIGPDSWYLFGALVPL